MKEKFEEVKLTGPINVACKYDDGSTRYWQTTKETVIEHIIAIVNAYRKLGYKLTLRQLHYQLVTRNWIVNHDTAYKKLGTILDDCRYGGLIDWSAIEDRGRVPHLLYHADSAQDAIEDTVSYFRLDRQDNQRKVVEVWTEKDALSGIMKRVTEKYHVRLCVNKGYTSSSAIYEAYQRIRGYIEDGRPVTILYFGDHDPSGLDMVRDIQERLTHMLHNGNGEYSYDDIEEGLLIRHIGLTKAQIDHFDLPPNPTKLTDTRAAKYIAKHGRQCWEVDALPPEELTALLEANIEDVIDMDYFQDKTDEEATERAKIKTIIRKLGTNPELFTDEQDNDEE